MSLEWAEKIQGLRKNLDLSQEELGDLLDVSQTLISHWEIAAGEATVCWERIIQFLIDCASEALRILKQKPWLQGDQDWAARIRKLLQKLDWTQAQLGEFVGANIGEIIHTAPESDPRSCNKIILSILEIYSDLNPEQWPPALYTKPHDVITPERIKLLRLGLAMRQRDIANLFHMDWSTVSGWERGDAAPRWCANLLLKIIETYPQAIDLIERIPWGDERVPVERVIEVRRSLRLTQLEMARLLGMSIAQMQRHEAEGIKDTGCTTLVYELVEQFPEEFMSYVEGLSTPGGQMCPIW